MARIPEEELERLKRETDLVALVQAAGVELRRHGANLVGRCVFHDDQGPSLVVTPAKNLWHCLDACQTGGSVIDWVMRRERVSFRHAVEWLRARAGSGPTQALTPIVTTAAEVESLEDGALVREVLGFYHETLKASPEAIAYLDARGLNSIPLIDHFQLGYANRTLGYRLQGSRWKAGAALRGRLQASGLLRPMGNEHFRGRLVVPILGERGQLVQCYGRALHDERRERQPLHLYLPGPHTAVWNVDALASNKEIILCEALLDAMTFGVAGFRNVITSYGVSGFTDVHRAALRRYGTERVLIAYDADAAGDRAAELLAPELIAMGIECYRVHFPRGQDANAYALANMPASESLGALLRGATWLGRGAPMIPSAELPALPLAAAPEVPSIAMPSGAVSLPSPLTLERAGDEIRGTIADRTYRVRGLAKNLSPDALRVNLLVTRGDAVHVDTLDLYVALARTLFIAQAAKEVGLSEETIKRDVGAVILALETLVTEQITTALPAVAAPSTMSDADREAALALLRDPTLLDRIVADFAQAGIVGEHQRAHRLSRSRLAETARAARDHRAECERRGENEPHGCGARLCAARGARAIFRDDRPGALLHGRDGSEAQGAGRGRGRRRGARELCLEIAAERRRADDRKHGQGSRLRQARDARVSRRRPGDDHAHHNRGGAR